MLSVEFITNMVIGVAIVVVAMMILLVFQIYKTEEKDDHQDKGSNS